MPEWLTPELLSVIFGVLVPFVTSFLKSCDWSISTKTALCGAISALAALGSLAVTGEITLANFGMNLPIVFASATAFYNLHFKDTAVNRKLSQTQVL